MAKHHQKQNNKPALRQAANPKSATAEPTRNQAGLAEQIEPLGLSGNNTLHAQATRFDYPHLQTAQRQALATQIGRVQGNEVLQRILARHEHNVQRQSNGTAASGVIQLSELSDELAQIWQEGDKGQFFDRLRTLNSPDQDLTAFVAQNLEGDDLWLAQNLLTYGPESEWPIFLQIEREMKGWGDSGGIPAVINLLQQAGQTDKQKVLTNMGLMDKLRQDAGAEDKFLQVMKLLVDVIHLPQGVIQDATALLAGSEHEIDRNTAQLLINGDITTYYFEDLEEPDDPLALLEQAGKDPMSYDVKYLPGTTDPLILPHKGTKGFATIHNGTKMLFIKKSYPLEEIKLAIIHEVSHLQNPRDPAGDPILEKYETEFRAYWVAEYRDITDLNERAEKVKQHVLAHHPDVANAYYTNKKIKKAIDRYNRPDGNLTNQ